MVKLHIDVADALGDVMPGDYVILRAPEVLVDSNQRVVTPSARNIPLYTETNEPLVVDVAPGPLGVTLRARNLEDSEEYIVQVPEGVESETLGNLLGNVIHYDPVVESWAYRNAERAVAAREEADESADTALEAEQGAIAARKVAQAHRDAAKDQADRAESEADRSRDEADRSHDEANRSRDEADRAREQAEWAEDSADRIGTAQRVLDAEAAAEQAALAADGHREEAKSHALASEQSHQDSSADADRAAEQAGRAKAEADRATVQATLSAGFADDANRRATDADNSATSADGSADFAHSRANDAADSEKNAATSASQAGDYASQADGSARDAAASQAAAQASQEAAADSEEAAGQHAATAKTEADRAQAEADRAGGLVDQRVAELIDGAPEQFDTLKELADGIMANHDTVQTVINGLAGKADAGRVEDIEQEIADYNDVTPRDEEGRPYWSYGLETQEWTDPATGEVHTVYIPKDGDLADIPEAYIPNGGTTTKFGVEMTVVNTSDEDRIFAVSFVSDSPYLTPGLWQPISPLYNTEFDTNAFATLIRAGSMMTYRSVEHLVAGSLDSNFRLTLADEVWTEGLGERVTQPAHPEDFGIVDLKIYRVHDRITALYQANQATSIARRLQNEMAPLEHDHEIDDVDGLGEALASKETVGHTHTSDDITDGVDYLTATEPSPGSVVKTYSDGSIRSVSDFDHANALTRKGYVDEGLSKKSDKGHGHKIADVEGLDEALAARSADGHKHTLADITNAPNSHATGPDGNTLVSRSSAGHFFVNTPTDERHPASKGYVDDGLDSKSDTGHKHTSADITDTTSWSGGADYAGKVLRLNEHGKVGVYPTPSAGDDLTNKRYVDREVAKKADAGHKHTSADITDAHHYTGGSMKDRVVKTYSDGHIYSASDPTSNSHLARKAYVDKKVAPMSGAGASIIPHVDGVQSWGVPVRSDFSTSGHGRYYSHNAGGTTTGANTFFKVDPSIPYYFSFWARATKAGSRIYIECHDQHGTHAVKSGAVPKGGAYLVGDLELPTEWTKFETVIRFKEGVSEARVAGVYWNHSNGSVRDATQYVTDLHLVPIAPHTHTSSDITDKYSGVWSGSNGDNRLIATSGGGYIQTSKDPVSGNDVTNKRYVDGKTWVSSDITDTTYRAGRLQDAYKVMKASGLGRLHYDRAPTDSNELANKKYVDDKANEVMTLTSLGREDLNTVTTAGFYWQGTNANAEAAANYPIPRAGYLEVWTSGNQVHQRYTDYQNNSVWTRTKYGSTWYTWWQLAQMRDVENRTPQVKVVGSLPSVPDANTLYIIRY